MSFFGGSKGPSAAEVAKKQEAAAQKERERIALEEAQQASSERQATQTAYAEATKKRQAFLASDEIEDDETKRRKFLKGV